MECPRFYRSVGLVSMYWRFGSKDVVRPLRMSSSFGWDSVEDEPISRFRQNRASEEGETTHVEESGSPRDPSACSLECAKTAMKQTYCVYNETRECFISLGVVPADTTFARLRGLIGRMKLKFDEGVWVVPSRGIHTLGVLFPLDLIYLDANHRVIHLSEHFPPFRIAALRAHAASVLQLPTHTIYSSQTQLGDQIRIFAPDEMKEQLDRAAVALGATASEVKM